MGYVFQEFSLKYFGYEDFTSGAVLNCQTKHDDPIFARANFCRFFSPHLIITSCSCRPTRAAGTLCDVM